MPFARKEGYLLKAPTTLGERIETLPPRRLGSRTLKRRYFVLQGNSLEYFAKKGDERPKGSVTLTPSTKIIERDDDFYGFIIIPSEESSRRLFAVAESGRERDAWVEKLAEAIAPHLYSREAKANKSSKGRGSRPMRLGESPSDQVVAKPKSSRDQDQWTMSFDSFSATTPSLPSRADEATQLFRSGGDPIEVQEGKTDDERGILSQEGPIVRTTRVGLAEAQKNQLRKSRSKPNLLSRKSGFGSVYHLGRSRKTKEEEQGSNGDSQNSPEKPKQKGSKDATDSQARKSWAPRKSNIFKGASLRRFGSSESSGGSSAVARTTASSRELSTLSRGDTEFSRSTSELQQTRSMYQPSYKFRMHPQNSTIRIQGYLLKRGGFHGGAKNYKRRYFVLMKDLYYFKSEDDFQEFDRILGLSSLSRTRSRSRKSTGGHVTADLDELPWHVMLQLDVFTVQKRAKHEGKQFDFFINCVNKELMLRAGSEDERKAWMDALREPYEEALKSDMTESLYGVDKEHKRLTSVLSHNAERISQISQMGENARRRHKSRRRRAAEELANNDEENGEDGRDDRRGGDDDDDDDDDGLFGRKSRLSRAVGSFSSLRSFGSFSLRKNGTSKSKRSDSPDDE